MTHVLDLLINLYTEVTGVNLSTFVYRLFHEDFTSIYGLVISLYIYSW